SRLPQRLPFTMRQLCVIPLLWESRMKPLGPTPQCHFRSNSGLRFSRLSLNPNLFCGLMPHGGSAGVGLDRDRLVVVLFEHAHPAARRNPRLMQKEQEFWV